MSLGYEQKLIEVMSELLAEVHEMRLEIKGMRSDLNGKIDGLADKIEKLETVQSKTNLAIGELRLSVMKLTDYGERILRLEKEVFSKAS
jgi:hypothetical protein